MLRPRPKADNLALRCGAKMTENLPAYTPISCAGYSEYELAILHRQRLRLTWCEDNVIYDRVVMPLDLQTRNSEEFLICRDGADETLTIRLDRIRKRRSA